MLYEYSVFLIDVVNLKNNVYLSTQLDLKLEEENFQFLQNSNYTVLKRSDCKNEQYANCVEIIYTICGKPFSFAGSNITSTIVFSAKTLKTLQASNTH